MRQNRSITFIVAIVLVLSATALASDMQAPAGNAPATKAAVKNTSASDATHHSSQKPATLESVNVLKGASGVSVEIVASGPVRPLVTTVQNPDRLVVDLPNTVSDPLIRHIPVNKDGIKSVRYALNDSNPPVTRVVVDMTQARDYEITPESNRIVLKLRGVHSGSKPAGMVQDNDPVVASKKPAAPAKTTAASVKPATTAKTTTASVKPAPAVKSTSASVKPTVSVKPASASSQGMPVLRDATVSSKQVVATPAAVKRSSETKPAVTAPATTPITVASSITPSKTAAAPNFMNVSKSGSQAQLRAMNTTPELPVKAAASTTQTVNTVSSKPADAKPNDFVFVEPSYQQKDQAQAANDPQARALQAASTMANTTTAAMMPPPSASSRPQSEATQAPSSASQAPSTMGPVAPQPAVNMAAQQQQQMKQSTGQAKQPHYSGEPISVNLKDVDLKDFFRLIHEISGLNVVLDPNVHGTLTIVLDDVPWDQALDIVLKNNQLDRQLEGNVLRIATMETLRKEAEARRAQVEAEALAVDKVTVTRFLSYAHAKDVVPTVRKFISQRGDAIADERTNAVIISDIPAVIPNIDRLLSQLDRKTQEVEIEARVVAATRTFARDIGTQLGFGYGNGVAAIGGNSQVGQTLNNVGYTAPPPYFTIPGFTAGQTAAQSLAIPLFSNFALTQPTSGLSFTNVTGAYRLDAYLTLAESRGLLKILSRPRVVTQNNIQALVRQGVRVPIVTQAQLGGPPTVTYVDAFLRLTVVPQITAENTIFLNVDVENTTPDFGREVQGNPTLITQQATTQVLVTDGGTVVIGGVIQTQNNVTVNQVPLLGSIPLLNNLFRQKNVSTSTQELIFFITPKIIQT
jgi:type IV pilus assembly protein PilQ